MIHDAGPLYSITEPFKLERRQDVGAQECPHLLIPTALKQREQPAIHIGLRIAAAMRAKVTLLHVIPVEECTPQVADPPNPWNWLDAIESLHQALATPRRPQDRLRILDQSQTRMRSYLERVASTFSDELPEVHLQCRIGEVAEEILQFADEQAVNLVILSSRLSRWNLSVLPARLHRLLQQNCKRAIVVHLDSPGDAESSAPQELLRNKQSLAF